MFIDYGDFVPLITSLIGGSYEDAFYVFEEIQDTGAFVNHTSISQCEVSIRSYIKKNYLIFEEGLE